MAIDIASFRDLNAAAADAGNALDRDNQLCLFDRLDWYRLVATYSPQLGDPLILRARDAGGSAWLFLARNGNSVTALANWYTFETGLVSDGEGAGELVKAIGRQLLVGERLRLIDLFPLREEQRLILADGFRRAGWVTSISTHSINWSIASPGADWQSFLAQRPSKLRNTIMRRQRKATLDIQIFTVFEDDKWDIYETVYKSSWKSEEGSPAMLRALARQEAAAGAMRLGLAFDADTPVAAQFWLVENGTATIHKLAYVETRRGQSPGTLLTAEMFRYVIERDRVQRMDFGLGDESYKADWMDQSQPLYRLRLHNPRTMRGLMEAARDGLSAIRQAIRRWR